MPFGLNIHCKAFPREKRKLLRTAQVYFQDDSVEQSENNIFSCACAKIKMRVEATAHIPSLADNTIPVS